MEQIKETRAEPPDCAVSEYVRQVAGWHVIG
jgi:hypothetical protein